MCREGEVGAEVYLVVDGKLAVETVKDGQVRGRQAGRLQGRQRTMTERMPCRALGSTLDPLVRTDDGVWYGRCLSSVCRCSSWPS